jgi:hypothetical protein
VVVVIMVAVVVVVVMIVVVIVVTHAGIPFEGCRDALRSTVSADRDSSRSQRKMFPSRPMMPRTRARG